MDLNSYRNNGKKYNKKLLEIEVRNYAFIHGFKIKKQVYKRKDNLGGNFFDLSEEIRSMQEENQGEKTENLLAIIYIPDTINPDMFNLPSIHVMNGNKSHIELLRRFAQVYKGYMIYNHLNSNKPYLILQARGSKN